jgi:hypothetical protein
MRPTHLSALKTMLSASLVVGTVLLNTPDVSAQGRSQRLPADFSILPITITSVTVQDGQLIANGLLGTNPFTSPLTINAVQSMGACPILDLSLGPIDLTLLGLRVETSPICLEITAFDGGGLLGDLLCSVANLLQGGMPLQAILGSLEASGDLPRVLNGLTALLNGAFDAITDNNPTQLAATCSVLSLSVGPLDLNLLGLQVVLDDCNDGPVTVDITAIPGGGLLGDLLCSLTNLLNGSGSGSAIQQLLWNISRLIGGLLG